MLLLCSRESTVLTENISQTLNTIKKLTEISCVDQTALADVEEDCSAHMPNNYC